MLSFEPNIVFIDDIEDEVIGIVKKYQDKGCGTRLFNANLFTGDNKPVVPFSDVNLIYLDLYYQDEFDVELCTGWIESIVPKNCFYVLVIWSRDTQHSEDVIQDLIKLDRKPFLCFEEKKDDTYKLKSGEWDFDKLHRNINTELNKVSELQELALWKKSVINSSNVIIGHLSKDIDPAVFNKKLQKIIIGHGGKRLESDDKFDQKRDVLFDALDNVLISNAKCTRPEQEISEENKQNLYKIENNIQTDIDPKLNSWFHFKLHKEPLIQNIIAPGLLCKYEEEELRTSYTILGDTNIDEYLKHQIAESILDGSNTAFIDIALLISRPCDIAQDKYGRNLKLISGILVKNPKRKNNPKKELKTGTKYDSIKLYDHLYFSEEENDVALIFDFRYVYSVKKQIFINKFENIKIFNKELLSDIQVEYSAYSSRLGITQII